MGFRYRKSINLGGGFRINLSKSGVGYSWGTKGYRVTKKASGGTRTTASIPGTGLSYVSETGKSKKQTSTQKAINQPVTYDSNHYAPEEIKNEKAETMVSEGLEDMLASANKALKSYSRSTICFAISLILGFANPLFFIVSLIAFIYGIYIKKKGTIVLDYTFEDNQASLVAERMKPLLNIAKSKKIWRITESSEVIDKKYSAGASSSLKRADCKSSSTVPFPFKTNSTAVAFKSGKETLLFLPDKLFVLQGNKVGALSYVNVTTSVHGQRFIERDSVPKDATVVDYTWQYVNKSGGPDKRFQNNKKIPICLYGEMEVSGGGVNTIIMFSNPNIER